MRIAAALLPVMWSKGRSSLDTKKTPHKAAFQINDKPQFSGVCAFQEWCILRQWSWLNNELWVVEFDWAGVE
ncbi:hypothetical protein [Rheinheimera sp. F8]|uniref:hypothetical protein n=1 Tax=Rheinheimera sp. F8 TaxID=1763998 RepID=UPI001AD84E2D|nr:hypothetical protein [Rheinheimera sp. F8]